LALDPYDGLLTIRDIHKRFTRVRLKLHPDKRRNHLLPLNIDYAKAQGLVDDLDNLTGSTADEIISSINERGKDGWRSTWAFENTIGN
jgi:hypothetical protein